MIVHELVSQECRSDSLVGIYIMGVCANDSFVSSETVNETQWQDAEY